MWCRELNEEFKTENDMFFALKLNKDDILALKKAKIQKSCEKGVGIPLKPFKMQILNENIKEFATDDEHHYIVVNATKILDSHGDVHIDGLWKKTIKDQQGKNYLVLDHKLEMPNVVARKGDIEMFTAEIPFSAIGKSYEGDTQALIYKVPKDKIINPLAKDWLESGEDIEASVRMRYINIKMAMDSVREEDKEEAKTYHDYIDQIANKSEFDRIPYFFVVSEAENVKESSLVLFGSNSSTGLLNNTSNAKSKGTTKIEVIEETVVTGKRRKSII